MNSEIKERAIAKIVSKLSGVLFDRQRIDYELTYNLIGAVDREALELRLASNKIEEQVYEYILECLQTEHDR